MNEWLAAELCADYAVAGAWSEAYMYARQRLASGSAVHAYMGSTYWLETETLIRAGQRELAAGEVRRFGERIGDQRRYRIPYLRALAILTLPTETMAQQRDKEASEWAVSYLREAAALAEEIGLPGELWPIYAALLNLHC